MCLRAERQIGEKVEKDRLKLQNSKLKNWQTEL